MWCLNKNIESFIYKSKALLFVLGIVYASALFGQNETNYWYFGERSGLYFELQENAQVLFNGNMVATEACATISDIDGNLQFYTNGTNIWDRTHNIMINGVLTGTLGGGVGPGGVTPDTLLNVIIVPIAEQANIYYVFTVSSSTGLSYSVIDMSLNNGLGAVVSKNTRLLTGEGVGKLSAVHHADGKSIWLMTTKANTNDVYTSFYAYKINTDGTIDPPVITDNLSFKGVQKGVMKFSPNGRKVACANYRPMSHNDHLAVFDFNPQVGTVSNRRNLLTSFVFFEVVSAYGVEFSNDSKYLYASLVRQGIYNPGTDDNFEPDTNRNNLLYQYDLSSMNPQEYATSLHEGFSDLTAAGLQLAKNGKIYRALAISGNQGTPFLGVIESPEILGVGANYRHNAVNLSPNQSRLGLPSFIQSYFRTRILAENICLGEPMAFEVDTYAGIIAAVWDFGDGNTSNDIAPKHSYGSGGSYEVTATITINDREITVTKKVRVFHLPELNDNQELVQCDNDTDGISTFNLNNIQSKITDIAQNEALYFYHTRNDALQDVNRIVNPDSYTNSVPNEEIFIRVVNQNDCFAVASFFIRAVFVDLGTIDAMYACDNSDSDPEDQKGIFALGFKKNDIRDDISLSADTRLRFFPTLLDAQTTKNEILERFYTTESTTIWVRAEEPDLTCSGMAPIDLIVNDAPVISINEDYLICQNQPVALSGDSSNDRFEWLDDTGVISTQSALSFSEPGTFTLIAYKTENGIECSNSRTFTINRTDIPVFSNIEVQEVSQNNHTISVAVDGGGAYEFSINGMDYFDASTGTYDFNNIPAGTHTVYVRDVNQCEPTIQEEVNIIGFPSFFTPNNDGINDFWEIKGLDSNAYDEVTVSVFDRYGKLIVILNTANNFRWDGTYKGYLAPQNDYWYEVIYSTGAIDRGHFSLIR
ncbi:T9SS type B sorting domain-containing protein [Seonamhaeicola sp.]|uniref:T9SS type B sorting domain-containing protein n=1 Tax=Seonamhaeicola sp. TaxID=1912245 RepID=UPI00260BE8FC|nr:T9SS type B sorting domain-containing protein [Seonamhaeicola sp.]